MLKTVERIVNNLEKLPGIGTKSAFRMVMELIKWNKDEIEELAMSILSIKNLRRCKVCFNITENEICEICSSEKRDRTKICVVEKISDITAIEKTGVYNGLYHVLDGLISPVDGVGPEQIHIKELKERVREGKVEEVIIATNPTTEGELTAQYIADMLKESGVKITRIARGIPAGTDLDLADEITIGLSIKGRETID